MEWISIDDRLPKDKQRVLVFVPDNNVYGYNRERECIHAATFVRSRIDGNNKKPYEWVNSPRKYFGQDISHWMILPSPPKGDNK